MEKQVQKPENSNKKNKSRASLRGFPKPINEKPN